MNIFDNYTHEVLSELITQSVDVLDIDGLQKTNNLKNSDN